MLESSHALNSTMHYRLQAILPKATGTYRPRYLFVKLLLLLWIVNDILLPAVVPVESLFVLLTYILVVVKLAVK